MFHFSYTHNACWPPFICIITKKTTAAYKPPVHDPFSLLYSLLRVTAFCLIQLIRLVSFCPEYLLHADPVLPSLGWLTHLLPGSYVHTCSSSLAISLSSLQLHLKIDSFSDGLCTLFAYRMHLLFSCNFILDLHHLYIVSLFAFIVKEFIGCVTSSCSGFVCRACVTVLVFLKKKKKSKNTLLKRYVEHEERKLNYKRTTKGMLILYGGTESNTSGEGK